ncbi:peptidoglycan-binding protein [Rheinheimera muenzenbergensis]|uniref:Peptidoglycan-binding protein n=1 Tax=Rheinheimera muenzenbergensis TaxID=1193628 RepID=A0ABU8C3I9_9GAMM|nr:peptidoglycan-binding protein [Gammaproteobacteria bacterium]MBU1554905.1 peptidoglycan-binding protein [Gammaproteobacteria bacterium]MBU2071890.1 peptidoglycan-binding protein [Gammaproteobacteria bacterium]MBU2181751.1 peptidoglycan-binding protein [Gammaproteobacteria bacterium]MBU2206339.1 peptidoglycan-binding protein [Gammaproteobacteria bacterium]
MSGSKTLLSISCCDQNGQPSGAGRFQAMINPASLNHQLGISYNSDSSTNLPIGKSAVESKLSQYQQEKLSFELVLDGTGAVPQAAATEVSEQVKQLKNVVYHYVGEKHEPSIVKLQWGQSFSFIGRLSSMTLDYTLFKPGGDPLRAKIKLNFGSYMSNKQEALKADRQSPDLTHQYHVKAGDTLPLLCYRQYKDSSYYLAVAEFNQLDSISMLVPGTVLYFPPLR